MLPPQQNSTSKRSNYHLNHSSRSSHGYHPYYSSSPVGVTANVHYVSSSSSSITSATSSNRYQSHKNNEYTSSSSSQEEDANLSSLSTQTNPPTTPASQTSANNTPQSTISSPVLQFKSKIEPILNVTPVTGSSTSSVSNYNYSASCSASSTSVGTITTNACSRSSSMASLNSFDVKSINSIANSEYSSAPMSAGFMTPAAYSDIPDSPGEIFPNIIHHTRLLTSSVNNSASNQRTTYNFMKSNMTMTCTGVNEISVLTCDSNPKSNDITLVEKTVLASNSHNNTNIISNYGTSGYSTLVINDDETQNVQNMSISEEIKKFESNDSMNESKPNISQLTFQDEPTPDIIAIHKILNKPQQSQPRFLQQQQQQQIQWPTFAFNQMTTFTPPVKLAPIEQNPNELIKTSKRLIYEEEDNRFPDDDQQYYKDEYKDLTNQEQDEDDKYSIASVPSDIVRDHQQQNLDVSNFSALLNRSKNLCRDTTKLYESSPLINTNTFIFDLIKQQSLMNNSYDITHNNITINNETVCKKIEEEKENVDDDEQLLDEFIDEMLPIAMANTNQNESQVDESLNEDDEQQLIKYQKIYENNLDNHVPLSNQLPKIDEEDEDELIKLREINKKRPIVQMNKTSQLRANKAMQTKANQTAATTKLNQSKENQTSSTKRPAISNSSSINSINQKQTNIVMQQAIKKPTLLTTSLNRLNTTTTTRTLKTDYKKT